MIHRDTTDGLLVGSFSFSPAAEPDRGGWPEPAVA